MENPPVRVQSPVLLPDELIREILSWLPVKSLVRFRSVCKSWNSFISEPSFVNSHLQKSPKNTDIILSFKVDDDTYAVPCSVRSLMENNPARFIAKDDSFRLKKGYRVCGSCNGLVCLLCYGKGPRVMECWFQFWNPATRIRSEKSPCIRVDWDYHPCCSLAVGFGYDDSCDTYKVVVVHLDSDFKNMEFKVLNMGDNCWRKMFSCPAFTFIYHCDGKFLSGTLNWLAIRRFDFRYVTTNELVIFSLDLGKETYKHLLLPDGLDEVPLQKPGLAVLRDCLCLFYDYKSTHFVIWQMKEFGVEKSWTQLLSISYQHLQIQILRHPLRLLPLCMHENGDDILLICMDNLEAILYNWRDNRVQSFEIHINKYGLTANDYVQSLVLPC